MKRKILSVIFFSYCVLASLFLTISGAFTTRAVELIIFQLLFLPVAGYFVIEALLMIRKKPQLDESLPQVTKKQIISFSIIFILIFSLGVMKVNTNAKESGEPLDSQVKPTSSPLIITSNQNETETQIKSIGILKVVIDDSPSVNIQDNASDQSDIVKKANDQEEYEYTQKINEWYEIILSDNELGYIFEGYVQILESE